jgi:3-polyprenyl-4-hydroxybenzoate decarboxylase
MNLFCPFSSRPCISNLRVRSLVRDIVTALTISWSGPVAFSFACRFVFCLTTVFFDIALFLQATRALLLAFGSMTSKQQRKQQQEQQHLQQQAPGRTRSGSRKTSNT